MIKYNKLHQYILWSLLLLTSSSIYAENNPVAYIVSPQHGETVNSPVTVVFGLSGMGIAPAGVEKANTGHHHLLVDTNELPPLDSPLGSEVRHFGGGQTEVTLELEPGEHTLQLILGDHLHRPHNPPVVSEKITINVKEKSVQQINIKNLRQISPTVYRSGQPTAEQISELSAKGVKHIVNLRPHDEMDWNEKQVTENAGMTYHNLPIPGAQGITFSNAKKLAALLQELDGESTLVHCSSSNRVGGLMALNKIVQGLDTENAIAAGKLWGLTRLEPFVRERIENCVSC